MQPLCREPVSCHAERPPGGLISTDSDRDSLEGSPLDTLSPRRKAARGRSVGNAERSGPRAVSVVDHNDRRRLAGDSRRCALAVRD